MESVSVAEIQGQVKEEEEVHEGDNRLIRVIKFISAFSKRLTDLGAKALLNDKSWQLWKDAVKAYSRSSANEGTQLWDSQPRQSPLRTSTLTAANKY
jgi:hypothetical protein